MKNLIIYFCLFVSIPLTGQVTSTSTHTLGDNPGLQYFIESFGKMNQHLENDLKSIELNYLPRNFYLHSDFSANLNKHLPKINMEMEIIDFRLGPDAFLSPREAQAIWNTAVSPFNPEHLLIGDNVGGFDLFNNMPILIIRPKIGTFINEQLLFNW